MSFVANDYDLQLIRAVYRGNFSAVKVALEAGANVNGSHRLPCPPVVAAAMAMDVGMVTFLLGEGADPEKPAIAKASCLTTGAAVVMGGERALHVAARTGSVEIVRLLLKRCRANPNAIDDTGHTPLLLACECYRFCLELVRLLLDAGGDAALAEEHGIAPLHVAAAKCSMGLVDMLYTAAPATLNCCGYEGKTPLFLACSDGQEGMVSKLLSLGAMQPMPVEKPAMCPLLEAARCNLVGVVQVLISEGGVHAVGGEKALMRALMMVVSFSRARILRLLLMVDGEEERSEWANANIGSRRLLHFGAGFCCPATVSVLLEAGADEVARDSDGRIPQDVIGLSISVNDEVDRAKEVAIRRMLQRGPAYRARSWAWPSGVEANAGGIGDGDSAAGALSSPPAVPKTPPR